MLDGVRDLLFPHAVHLLEAKWKELQQEYGETAIAFSVRFRSLAQGLHRNPEDFKTKFIECLDSPVMRDRVACASTISTMTLDDMAKYHDDSKYVTGMVNGSKEGKSNMGISMLEEEDEEVCAIGNQGFGPTRGGGRGARGSFGWAMVGRGFMGRGGGNVLGVLFQEGEVQLGEQIVLLLTIVL